MSKTSFLHNLSSFKKELQDLAKETKANSLVILALSGWVGKNLAGQVQSPSLRKKHKRESNLQKGRRYAIVSRVL
jgi:hypothetical protein